MRMRTGNEASYRWHLDWHCHLTSLRTCGELQIKEKRSLAVSHEWLQLRQECIPVWCVPPAAVAIHGVGGLCLSACWDNGCGHGPPWSDPSTSPLGVGLETPPGDLQGMLGYHLQGMLGYPQETCCKACWDTTCNAYRDTTPPVNRITDTCKNITLPQLRCRR